MAEKSIEGVEAVIHKAARELAADVQRTFGVSIESIDFQWAEAVGGDKLLVKVSMHTSS